jgi:hypothetical protein
MLHCQMELAVRLHDRLQQECASHAALAAGPCSVTAHTDLAAGDARGMPEWQTESCGKCYQPSDVKAAAGGTVSRLLMKQHQPRGPGGAAAAVAAGGAGANAAVLVPGAAAAGVAINAADDDLAPKALCLECVRQTWLTVPLVVPDKSSTIISSSHPESRIFAVSPAAELSNFVSSFLIALLGPRTAESAL